MERPTKQLNEEFPDKKLSEDHIRELSKAVERDGGWLPWLAKKGFIRLDADNRIAAVFQIEEMNGQEVVRGTGVYYRTNIPFEFWNRAYLALSHYQGRMEKTRKQDLLRQPGLSTL